jgi:Uma2 family endonuclease
MSVATGTLEHRDQRVLLRNISWPTYEALLVESARSGTRLTYNRGVLEIMTPSREHERVKTLIGRMIEAMALELGIVASGAGSTTIRDQMREQGVEPDECYYIANEPLVRDHDDLDLTSDPPPDLAIEVDLTSSSLDQLAIYASFGVPEVWICDGTSIKAFHLSPAGEYTPQSCSLAFPFLPLDQLQGFQNRRRSVDDL